MAGRTVAPCSRARSASPPDPVAGAVARRSLLAALLVAPVVLLPPEDAAEAAGPAADPPVRVFFIRGFLNVFSTGFDRMAEKLAARGIGACVYGHLAGAQVRADVLSATRTMGKRRRPIVIVGHSFGANAALEVSARLARDAVPVALVVTVDPTHPEPLSPNVARYENYFFAGNGLGQRLASDKFAGRISNVDLAGRADIAGSGTGHFSVTTNAAFEKLILARILSALD